MEHSTGSGAAGPPEAEEATAAGKLPAAGQPPATGEPPRTGEPPATGEPRVDAALGRLDELDELPLSEHPAVYEWIHEELVEVLGDLHPMQAPTDKLPAEQAGDHPPTEDGSAGPGAG